VKQAREEVGSALGGAQQAYAPRVSFQADFNPECPPRAGTLIEIIILGVLSWFLFFQGRRRSRLGIG
jgi:hypothetical protein